MDILPNLFNHSTSVAACLGGHLGRKCYIPGFHIFSNFAVSMVLGLFILLPFESASVLEDVMTSYLFHCWWFLLAIQYSYVSSLEKKVFKHNNLPFQKKKMLLIFRSLNLFIVCQSLST